MKKIYVYTILCAICALVSCNNAKLEEAPDKEALKEETKKYKKMLSGKWRQKSTVVYVEELENPEALEIPEDVATYHIFSEDGIVRRGNETIGYDSIEYEVRGDTVKIAEANLVIEKLTDEGLIWTCAVENGSVKEIFVRVK